MGLFSKRKPSDDKFNLRANPDSLTAFYMDTMMCTDYYFKNEECMEDYLGRRGTPWSFVTGKNRKLYKECLDYLDQYKACIVGINQERIVQTPRKHLSEMDIYAKRVEQREKTLETEKQEGSNKKEDTEEMLRF